jgi:hypothetical protein
MSGFGSRSAALPRLAALLVAGLTLGVPTAGAGVSGYYGNPTQRPSRVTATLDTCHSGPTPADRYATFSGQMTTVPHADTMAMRFTLMARQPGESGPKRLSAPGLDAWQHSASHVDIFRYKQEVSNLPAGASVRALLTYRWLDANGKVLRHVTRRSPVCQVPDLRPNLVLETITHALGSDAHSDTYNVEVRNAGLGPAGSFNVLLSVGGNPLPTQTVDALGPAVVRILSFTGPRCTPGQSLQGTADPDNRIDEPTKADNVKAVLC